MQLGTIDRSPPPFFRQGPSALTKLALFSALAVCLMAADTRWKLTGPLRGAIVTALRPLQQALQVPVDLALQGGDYLHGLKRALDSENAIRAQMAKLSERAGRADQLASENNRLRALLELRPALTARTQSAEVLYEAGDPFSRKLFIDRGVRHGVVAGAPVLNEAGVLGQVTEVYPLSSVVTLLVDRDAAVPVLNTRTQARGVVFGGVDGGTALELRYIAANADVQEGDALVTSGLDGIYPPGLAVAKVRKVERRSDAGFARVLLTPAASANGVRHLLLVEPLGAQMPARPAPSEPAAKPGKAASAAASGKAGKLAVGAARAAPAAAVPPTSAASAASGGRR